MSSSSVVETVSKQAELESGNFNHVKIEPSKIPQGFKVIEEGFASVLSSVAVFYNKVQVFNRDVSSLVIKEYVKVLQNEADELYAKKLKKNPILPKPAPVSIEIAETFSASGLRSIRYWKEIPQISKIYLNDLAPDAVDLIKKNVELNQISLEKCIPVHSDAIEFLARNPTKSMNFSDVGMFDVIDIDPFGSASHFLDSALYAAKDGGLLCVTCTDLAVLAGNHPGSCFVKYGVMPLQGMESCHEMALRIVLCRIQHAALRFKKVIEPLLSLSVDFYVRVFVRVKTCPSEAQKACLKIGNIYQCLQCDGFFVQPLAKPKIKAKKDERDAETENEPKQPKNKQQINQENQAANHITPAKHELGTECACCGGSLKIGGPFWTGELHNVQFVNNLIKTLVLDNPTCCHGVSLPPGSPKKSKQKEDKDFLPSANKKPGFFATSPRIFGILTMISKELTDSVLFYDHGQLGSSLGLSSPPFDTIKSAFVSLGYNLSQTHCKPLGFKTNAPIQLIYDIYLYYAEKFKGVSLEVKKPEPEGEITKKKQKKEQKHKLFQILCAKKPSKSTTGDNDKERFCFDTEKVSFKVVDEVKKNVSAFFPKPEKYWGPGSLPKPSHVEKPQPMELEDENEKKRKREAIEDQVVKVEAENAAKKPKIE